MDIHEAVDLTFQGHSIRRPVWPETWVISFCLCGCNSMKGHVPTPVDIEADDWITLGVPH